MFTHKNTRIGKDDQEDQRLRPSPIQRASAASRWATSNCTLLDEYTDAQVARIVNERGLKTGAGDAFDAVSIQWVRFAAKLASLKERLIAAGMLTTKQLGDKLGVKRSTIGRWRTRGLIQARICNDLGEWLYWLPEETPPHRQPPIKTVVGKSTVRGAM